jgi:hypothetical protein
MRVKNALVQDLLGIMQLEMSDFGRFYTALTRRCRAQVKAEYSADLHFPGVRRDISYDLGNITETLVFIVVQILHEYDLVSRIWRVFVARKPLRLRCCCRGCVLVAVSVRQEVVGTDKKDAFVQGPADHESCGCSEAQMGCRWGANGIQVPPAYWLLEPLRATWKKCKQNIVDDFGEAEYSSYRASFLRLLRRSPKARY